MWNRLKTKIRARLTPIDLGGTFALGLAVGVTVWSWRGIGAGIAAGTFIWIFVWASLVLEGEPDNELVAEGKARRSWF